MNNKLLTTKSGRVKELKRKTIRAMLPASQVLPKELLDILPKQKKSKPG